MKTRTKSIIILVLQIFVVGVTALLFMAHSQRTIQPVDVYIYNTDVISMAKPLGEGDIKRITIPKAAMNNDFVVNKEDAIGKHVSSQVKAGQHIYKSQLINKEDVDIFETLDLSKYRKVSLPISLEEGFGGNIKRGDRIDLIYTGVGEKKDESSIGGGSTKFNYSKTFLQNILVYQVNTGDGYKYSDRSQYTPSDALYNEQLSVGDESEKLEIITLAVTLEQAEEISARLNSGKISFVGRFGDSDNYETLGYVLGDYEKIFSGQGFAETGNVSIEEDIEKIEK